MPTKQHVFQCPICDELSGRIIRGSESDLRLAAANHIRMIHEERAALIAVDRARIDCRTANCEIGRSSHWNKTIGCPELTLSEFDKTLLAAMKIKISEDK